ncbi:MAG: glycosyltransferase family 4 protein [Planctomycetota bacterium]
MRIAVDGTHAINDHRAIRRYARHLIAELRQLGDDAPFEQCFLYLFANATAAISPTEHARQHNIISQVPARFLLPAMRLLGWPGVETLARRRGLGRERFDLIHFPGGVPFLPNRAPHVLTTVHGFAHVRVPHTMPARTVRVLERKYAQCLARSTHFITVSETSRREMMEIYGTPAERITAIPLGVSPEFTPEPLDARRIESLRRRYQLDADRIAIYVGALEPHKNTNTLLRAFDLATARSRDPWQLLLVGPQSAHAAELRARVDRERVRFVHHLEPGSLELADLYKLARALVFPSHYESWASPPLEAMASGTPAITSDLPSLRESTGGVATYVAPDDADGFASALLHLDANADHFETQRRRGIEIAATHTWQRCARNTLACYCRLLGLETHHHYGQAGDEKQSSAPLGSVTHASLPVPLAKR